MRALVRPTGSIEPLRQLGVEVFLGDVRRFEEVNSAAAGMDVIVHWRQVFEEARNSL